MAGQFSGQFDLPTNFLNSFLARFLASFPANFPTRPDQSHQPSGLRWFGIRKLLSTPLGRGLPLPLPLHWTLPPFAYIGWLAGRALHLPTGGAKASQGKPRPDIICFIFFRAPSHDLQSCSAFFRSGAESALFMKCPGHIVIPLDCLSCMHRIGDAVPWAGHRCANVIELSPCPNYEAAEPGSENCRCSTKRSSMGNLLSAG